jgi:hypothetical protein
MFIGSLMAHWKYLTTGRTHGPFGFCLTSVRNLSEALSKFQRAKWLISFPFRMLSVFGVCRTRMKIFLWQRLIIRPSPILSRCHKLRICDIINLHKCSFKPFFLSFYFFLFLSISNYFKIINN